MEAITKISSKTAVTTEIDGYKITTEPPVVAGGTGEFPPATRMVVASLLNCSFSGVKAFCESREISTEGLEMHFKGEMEEGIYKDMVFTLKLPDGFPEKYRSAMDKVVGACAVKKIMRNLPEIQLVVEP